MIAPPEVVKNRPVTWLDPTAYKLLGRLQHSLKPTERRLLVFQLGTALKQYEKLALSIRDVRQRLFRQYNEMVKAGVATSQLSRKFNMSVRGHNAIVGQNIDMAFKLAHEYDRILRRDYAYSVLRDAGLSFRTLLRPEIVDIAKVNSPAAARELLRIDQFRYELFRSTVKMAIVIARNHSERIDGDVVEWEDLAQEAIIAAKEAVDNYHPIEDGKTFTSYVYTWVSGIVSKKVYETTRTVFLPRTTLDRYHYVDRAVKELGLLMTELKGGIRPSGTLSEGKVGYDTLCEIARVATRLQRGNKPFFADEVLELLKTTQDEVSLDMEVDGAEGEETLTLVETLTDGAFLTDEQYDGRQLSRRLMALIKQFTTPEEYLIMELRYGCGEVVGCQRVTDQYVSGTGRSTNKTKVGNIDKDVISRVKEIIKRDPEARRQFRELLETTPFMEVL